MMSGVTERSSYSQKGSILGNMDTLWFHKAVLFSNPMSVPSISGTRSDKTLISPNMSSMCSSWTSSDDQEMIHPLGVEYEGLTSSVSLISTSQDGDFDVVTEEHEQFSFGEFPLLNETKEEESNSTESTPTHRHNRRRRRRATLPRRAKLLERTLSCKSTMELEEEELKGFMDLGFNFEKDRLTPRMISILPGLQRLRQESTEKVHHEEEDDDSQENETASTATTTDDQETTLEESSSGQVIKNRQPYLSESWSIERPDSPLLRMRMPTVFSAPDDMKRLLKVWVKTVAVAVRD